MDEAAGLKVRDSHGFSPEESVDEHDGKVITDAFKT